MSLSLSFLIQTFLIQTFRSRPNFFISCKVSDQTGLINDLRAAVSINL